MILNGWMIVLLLIAVVFLVVKVVNKKQALAVKATLALFLFVTLTVSYVLINEDVNLTSVDGVMQAVKVYFVWLSQLGNNAAEVTGYIVNQDWSLNATNSTG